MTHFHVRLHIDGAWRDGAAGESISIINPATEDTIGTVAKAERADLDSALAAAERGFAAWRRVSAFERCQIMRKAANLLRERVEDIAPLMVMEHGKPLAETLAAADIIDWFAEEGRRAYCRLIPARQPASTLPCLHCDWVKP